MAATQLLGRALLTGVAIAGVLTPAAATATEAPTRLHLTLTPFGQPPRAVDLTCAPVGGTHPDAGSACSALTAAGGDFRAIDTGSGNTACPMVYSPVTVGAGGTWQGASVVYEQTFENACMLKAATGAVFRF